MTMSSAVRGVIRLGLLFESGIDPVAQLETLLLMERIDNPESTPTLPDSTRPTDLPSICREGTPHIGRGNRRRVSKQALMFGLCTAHVYDPARPVLWTTASLSRGLDLFSSERRRN